MIVPCLPHHLASVTAQVEQVPDQAMLIGAAPELLRGFAYSVLQDDDCLFCGGVMAKWHGSGTAWALFSPRARPAMLAITRFALKILDVAPYRRIETTALTGFIPAHRWLSRLGFEMEAATMRNFDPAGRTHTLYSRVR